MAPTMLTHFLASACNRQSRWHRAAVSIGTFALLGPIAGCGGARTAADAPLGPENAQKAIEIYDANGDGGLSMDELKKSPPLLASMPRLDKDRNGTISLAELTSRMETLAAGARYIGLDVRIVEGGRPVVGAQLTLVPEPFMQAGSPKYSGVSSVGGFCSIKSEGPRLPGVPVGWYVATIIVPDAHRSVTKGAEIASDVTGNRIEFSL
jgi:EF hand